MTRPSPREVYDDPGSFWAYVTQPTDDDFEGQHFDRKEAGKPQPTGGLSSTALGNVRELVVKTVSAFANRNVEGGLLVLGISSFGDVYGVDHLSETQCNDITDLNKLLLHHAADVRFFDCTDAAGNARTLCLIFSGFSTTGICETVGNHPRAWTRNGSQCVQVTQAVRDNLRIRKGLVSIESDPVCEFSVEDIDKDVLAEFRKVFQPDTIRPETANDHDSIRDILIAAFANHPYSHQTEHLIVEGLRADGAMTLSLVAELDGNVVGQVAFSPVKIDGKDCEWLGLGPVAVTPCLQRRGIGQALVNEGLKQIRDQGAKGCVLVGDPAFYRRFGFENNPALRMEGVPAEVLVCLPMGDQMLEGTVTHHPAFFVGIDHPG